MHTLRATVDLAAGRELGTLVDTAMARPRIALTSSLAAMEAAGWALRWLRKAAPARIADPALWAEIVGLLDALEVVAGSGSVEQVLAGAGVRMLAAAGWQLELGRCVRCGKPEHGPSWTCARVAWSVRIAARPA
jgi:DNA repair protein RecO (recombination protein O)